MAIAGLAALYGLGAPTDTRLWGVTINQPDLPWWVLDVLSWLAMVKSIREGVPGVDCSEDYRQLLEMHLKEKPPSFLYKFYTDWANRMESEQRTQKTAQQTKKRKR